MALVMWGNEVGWVQGRLGSAVFRRHGSGGLVRAMPAYSKALVTQDSPAVRLSGAARLWTQISDAERAAWFNGCGSWDFARTRFIYVVSIRHRFGYGWDTSIPTPWFEGPDPRPFSVLIDQFHHWAMIYALPILPFLEGVWTVAVNVYRNGRLIERGRGKGPWRLYVEGGAADFWKAWDECVGRIPGGTTLQITVQEFERGSAEYGRAYTMTYDLPDGG
jgi:hypothetical protein